MSKLLACDCMDRSLHLDWTQIPKKICLSGSRFERILYGVEMSSGRRFVYRKTTNELQTLPPLFQPLHGRASHNQLLSTQAIVNDEFQLFVSKPISWSNYFRLFISSVIHQIPMGDQCQGGIKWHSQEIHKEWSTWDT